MAWLDVSNFGAIPHSALEAAITSSGTSEDLLKIAKDIYSGASSAVVTAGGRTADIPVQSGIRQGCPLSGLLFIMAIDKVITILQGTDTEHRALAFADDVCLLANNKDDLQHAINQAKTSLSPLGLSLNPGKCASLHISGQHPVGVRDTVFRLDDISLNSLAEEAATTFQVPRSDFT